MSGEWEVVWSGGELLPPRSEHPSWMTREGFAPLPQTWRQGRCTKTMSHWRDPAFVRQVRAVAAQGASQREIARRLGCSTTQVWQALHGYRKGRTR